MPRVRGFSHPPKSLVQVMTQSRRGAILCLRGESFTHHTNQMRLLSVITAATAVGASFFATSPIQAVDFPFRTLGFDYEQQFPCTLIVLSNQPSENQDDLGLWLTPPNPQGLVRYPAECVNEYEGSSATIPADLQVDCTNKQMGSDSWGAIDVFYDENKKVFTSNTLGWEFSIKGKNHESYLHNVIYKPIYQAICQS